MIVLVWNNDRYREISNYMADRGIPRIGVDIYTPDFIAIARGFGCTADRATSLDHLGALVAAATQRSTPALIPEIREDAPFLAT